MTNDTDVSQASTKPPTKPEPGSHTPGSSALGVVNLVVLLASLGLLGYLIYMHHEQSNADKPIKEAATKATKAEQDLKPEVEKLKSDLNDLAKKVDSLPAPPNYAPQIKALEDRVVDLGKSMADATGGLDALGKKVAGLTKGDGLETSPKFEAVERQMAEVAGDLQAVKAKLDTMTTPAAMASNEMDQAVAIFKQGKWAEAKEDFVKLQTISPDDARVWYFSAIATGLADRNWKGESERLVAEGMAREKAGKPEKAKIDAAFSDLTPATGKDWLAFYRNRVAQAPENR